MALSGDEEDCGGGFSHILYLDPRCGAARAGRLRGLLLYF
jgi:hypothetical protein